MQFAIEYKLKEPRVAHVLQQRGAHAARDPGRWACRTSASCSTWATPSSRKRRRPRRCSWSRAAARLASVEVNDNWREWDDDMTVGSVHLVETLEFMLRAAPDRLARGRSCSTSSPSARIRSPRRARASARCGGSTRSSTASTSTRSGAAQERQDALGAQRLVLDLLLGGTLTTAAGDRAAGDTSRSKLRAPGRGDPAARPADGRRCRERAHRRRLLGHRHPGHALLRRAARGPRAPRRSRARPLHPQQGPLRAARSTRRSRTAASFPSTSCGRSWRRSRA